MYIKTYSGKMFDVFNCGSIDTGDGARLYIDILNVSFSDIAPVFSDSNETEVITYYTDNAPQRVYTGFTELHGISYKNDGYWNVHLEKHLEV